MTLSAPLFYEQRVIHCANIINKECLIRRAKKNQIQGTRRLYRNYKKTS